MALNLRCVAVLLLLACLMTLLTTRTSSLLGVYSGKKIGVPMGGSASSELATLYCSYRELLFVRFTRQPVRGIRFIDDVLQARAATEASNLLAIDYGINFGSVEIGLSKANFVGLTITNSCPPAICIYDRRLEFGCDVVRLPHASSALAAHTAPAVVCGKLCRAWALSSSRAAFAEQACISTLLSAGRNTSLNAIKKGWGLFLRRLLPDFILDERLAAIKSCCLALAGLAVEERLVYLQQLEAKARERQRSRRAGTSAALPGATIAATTAATTTTATTTTAVTTPTTTTATTSTASSTPRRSGITNLGNTCYLAVSLQLAASLKARAREALSLRVCQAVSDARLGLTREAVTPSRALVRALLPGGLNPHDPNCASECFERLLECYADTAYTSVQLIQTCTCVCGSTSSKPDVSTFLYLTPRSKDQSLDLAVAVQREYVDQTRVTVNCSTCAASRRLDSYNTRQSKCSRITHTGPFGVYALKRAQPGRARCDLPVSTPLTMVIAARHFTLLAVAFHHGAGSDNGHYTCLVSEQDGWLHCSDRVITPVSNAARFLKDHETEATLWLYGPDAAVNTLPHATSPVRHMRTRAMTLAVAASTAVVTTTSSVTTATTTTATTATTTAAHPHPHPLHHTRSRTRTHDPL
jgi:hypothetical protein